MEHESAHYYYGLAYLLPTHYVYYIPRLDGQSFWDLMDELHQGLLINYVTAFWGFSEPPSLPSKTPQSPYPFALA